MMGKELAPQKCSYTVGVKFIVLGTTKGLLHFPYFLGLGNCVAIPYYTRAKEVQG